MGGATAGLGGVAAGSWSMPETRADTEDDDDESQPEAADS